MALTVRLAAAGLAALALAALPSPAHAYWRCAGTGAGEVATRAGSPAAVTATLAVNKKTVVVSGAAGRGAYATSVTVTLCRSAVRPCPAGQQAAAGTATVAATGTYTWTSPSLGNGSTVYGWATQAETSGWTDYSAVAGPVTV
ncbi:hypothetical protein Daura_16215 [Dactylosporangium aurantiacum]|uniref:Uncharacterized protein n=1 Tax=Dactylosporangium aurantiacum TaxID=35754 RepID=A0A9Q9MFU0_9ACTN|nr:hypothetical protein [Dactylosporangium aurantiacum]MDG6103051.1 hypothetical protein [Dactylosporangium aurantiacum]UWZ57563.1 hypothetical protein Daura_16215 [Dactylosporangium aurantiacum]